MSEIRRDLITGRWVIISPPRGKRAEDFRCDIPYDKTPPECPFCHGKESLTPPEITALRPDGSRPNEPGWQVRVIPNRHPALKIEQEFVKKGKGIYDCISGFGAHEIVVDTPDHHKTLKDMSEEEIHRVLVVLQSRLEDLYRDHRLRSVVITKSEGPLAGAYFSHAHHQILATPVIPHNLKSHLQGAENYYRGKERCIYCDILEEERESGERIVYENDFFLAFCPYASRHPFEVWIVPKLHEAHFFNARFQSYSLAQVFRVVATRLSLALGNLQYTSMIYTAPNAVGGKNSWRTLKDDFHWHIEIIPYFMKPVSVERGIDLSLNPTFPEEAAKFLRELPVFL